VIELEPLDVRHVRPLRELHQQPGVAAWWGPMEPMFPFDEPESTRYAIVVGGEIAGLIQHGESDWPVERHAYVDIFLGDDYAGRGIGTEAVKRIVEKLTGELGYRRVLIDPSSQNERAIRSYEKAGFRRVGAFAAAADSHAPGDDLYMELVVTDS
jgi:aminoglycoside 6'-N-acetyltransferase